MEKSVVKFWFQMQVAAVQPVGRAVQFDSIETRVQSAYRSCAQNYN
jgi:hypothetical protein